MMSDSGSKPSILLLAALCLTEATHGFARDHTNEKTPPSPAIHQDTGATGAPKCTLKASPQEIPPGGYAALSVHCTPVATSHTWFGTGFPDSVTAGTVSPKATTTYTIIGRNKEGAGDRASATVTVTGTTPVEPVPICNLTATPGAAGPGEPVELKADCIPAASSYTWINPAFPATSSGGTVKPVGVTTYTVVGNNAAGAGNRASVTVQAPGAAPPADPAKALGDWPRLIKTR